MTLDGVQTVELETDRPGVVSAALREAIEQYRGDVDDPRVDITREDLEHLGDLVDALDVSGEVRRELAFAEEYVGPIALEEKTATVRYDDADELAVGDVADLVVDDGRRFAIAEITRTATCNAIGALEVIKLFGAEYPTDDIDAMIEGVNRHYDDAIGPATTVRVIVFDVLEMGPEEAIDDYAAGAAPGGDSE